MEMFSEQFRVPPLGRKYKDERRNKEAESEIKTILPLAKVSQSALLCENSPVIYRSR
jgi:hypothetical protein